MARRQYMMIVILRRWFSRNGGKPTNLGVFVTPGNVERGFLRLAPRRCSAWHGAGRGSRTWTPAASTTLPHRHGASRLSDGRSGRSPPRTAQERSRRALRGSTGGTSIGGPRDRQPTFWSRDPIDIFGEDTERCPTLLERARSQSLRFHPGRSCREHRSAVWTGNSHRNRSLTPRDFRACLAASCRVFCWGRRSLEPTGYILQYTRSAGRVP